MKLNVSFDGLKLNNPLMPASGPLVGDLEKLNYLSNQNVGALVTKTISTTEAKIPRPCIYGDKYYVMNSELWSEHSKEMWINEILPFLDKKNRPLIISVGYTKEDMEILIPLLNPFADAFEVSTHYVGKNLLDIKAIVHTIRKHTDKPLYMKISPHISEVVKFAKAVKSEGASGIVAINSLGPTMKIDINKRKIIYGNDSGFAWTSGPAIKNLALATVYTISEEVEDFTIIGVGGIESADDVIEFLLAGANSVQMLSAALLNGKDLYKKIIDDLPNALKKYGFNSVQEVIDTKLNKKISYVKKILNVDLSKCIECRLCEKICPYFAISFNDHIEFDNEKCFGCELCVSKCPVKAIYTKRRKDD